jgi:hypothetical protein
VTAARSAVRHGDVVRLVPPALRACDAPADTAREALLDAAVRQHRMPAAAVETWRALYVEDPVGTRAQILALRTCALWQGARR